MPTLNILNVQELNRANTMLNDVGSILIREVNKIPKTLLNHIMQDYAETSNQLSYALNNMDMIINNIGIDTNASLERLKTTLDATIYAADVISVKLTDMGEVAKKYKYLAYEKLFHMLATKTNYASHKMNDTLKELHSASYF
jgi:hypothetical protein